MQQLKPLLPLGALVLAGSALVGGELQAQTAAPNMVISVDALADRHPINPEIYGVAHATTAILAELNAPLNRQGGNNTSRYNWQQNADNRGNDWYYESIAENSATPGERGDRFITDSRNAGAQAMLTIPTIGWVAKVGVNRQKLASFSVAKYGAQTGTDWQWYPDAGNGILKSTGQPIQGNDPNDANVASDAAFQRGWVNALVGKWGASASGGLRYYILDNEPSIWYSTHRDVHPVGPTMDEIRDKMVDYATQIKAEDPGAQVVGPEEWGWAGYLYSGYDQQYGNKNGWGYLPDRAAHGGQSYLPWLLDQLHKNEQATGQRLLDVFTVHYYPQGGEFGNDTSSAMQLRRNRSTRSLWDPTYVDETWVNDRVQLIPRLKGWVNTYYPGTRIGITEYNWGAEGHINGATAQADVYGIFGREGLDMGARWTYPDPSTPTFKAMKLYRNYDGQKSTFGDVSVRTTVPNPDNVSGFASVRSADGALTVMLINKQGTSGPVTLNLANFSTAGRAEPWQLTAANAITRLPDLTVSGTSLTTTLPAQSITLLVIPAASTAPAPAPTFTSSATASPASVATSAGSTLSATVTCATGSTANCVVDLEVYNTAGTKVGQQFWTAQSFTTGQQRTYAYAWTAPATAGTYTVKLGVFSPDWTAVYHWNNAAGSVTVTQPVPAPAVPLNLAATAGNARVSLTWSAAAGAATYRVKRATVNGGPYAVMGDPLTATSYADTSVTNGTTYYYVVSAANAGGESANSTQVAASPTAPLPTAPATPGNPQATAGNAQVSLAWTASAGATSYTVKRSSTPGSGYSAIAGGLASTSYLDQSVTNGSTYYYVVSAVNSGGESANSVQVSATPKPPLPGTPLNVTATAGNARVTLTWSAVAGATTYRVKRATTSSGPYTVAGDQLAATSYADTTVSNGVTYYYVVTAVNSAGEGAVSAQVSALPAAPAAQPVFKATTTANPASITLGKSATIATTVTCTAAPPATAQVLVQVFNSAGALVGQKATPNQVFTIGQGRWFGYIWTAPSVAGTHRVRVAVLSADGSKTYYANDNAASVVVR